jgi:phosphatidylinositol alpha-1,6-mannosyltransferase
MARYYADLAAGWGAGFTVLAGSWGGVGGAASGGEAMIPLQGVDARSAHKPRAVWRGARQLRAQIRERHPGFLLAGNIRPYAPVVRRAAHRAALPWGFFAHGMDLLRTAERWRHHPLKWWRWRALFDAKLIITNSRYTAGEATTLGFAADRIAVVPPEVDTSRFRPARDREEVLAERRRLDLPIDGVLTLFVGRLVERKGLDELLAALALTPNARLIVVGAGDAEPWRARAAAAGVAERVMFRGSPADGELPRWYRAADIFASPARHRTRGGDVEGFGIVFLEAQASGLPVLATRAGGIPEAVEEGRTALLVLPGDVRALAAGWQRLLDDPGLRRSLGAAGPSGAPKRHGPGSSARRLAAALDRHLASSPAPPRL